MVDGYAICLASKTGGSPQRYMGRSEIYQFLFHVSYCNSSFLL